MKFSLFNPSASLKHIVKYYWALHSSPYDVLPKEYVGTADGNAEWVFQIKGGFKEYERFKAYLITSHSRYRKIHLKNELELFGVNFYPQIIPQLHRIPADRVINSIYNLDDILPSGHSISEQVINSSGTEDRIRILNNFLTFYLKDYKSDPMSDIVNKVMQWQGSIDIAKLRQPTGLSIRQFERRFKSIAGFPPKYLARIVRFSSAKKKYATGNYKNLVELALDCNYYDQSHFNRDCKEFAGMHPSQYFLMLNVLNNDCGMREMIALK